jgi:hypothetical protein
VSDTDYRYEWKRWHLRNSDMRNTWGPTRTEAVRGVEITDETMPEDKAHAGSDAGQTYLTEETEAERTAQRHSHIWSVEEPA